MSRGVIFSLPVGLKTWVLRREVELLTVLDWIAVPNLLDARP
jgi:hypothetical protein